MATQTSGPSSTQGLPLTRGGTLIMISRDAVPEEPRHRVHILGRAHRVEFFTRPRRSEAEADDSRHINIVWNIHNHELGPTQTQELLNAITLCLDFAEANPNKYTIHLVGDFNFVLER